MTRTTKYVFGALSLVLLLLVLLIVLYIQAERPAWAMKQNAEQEVMHQYDLQRVTKTELFNGTKPYQIVFGVDAQDRKVIVWHSKTKDHEELAANGVNEQQIKTIIEQYGPDTSIIHILPGVWDGQYVWESCYSRIIGGRKQYFYDYNQFKNGEHIITLKVTLNS